jgi:broad specificity phosphatase PhoE
LEDPFVESFEGMCELLLVRHGEPLYHERLRIGEFGSIPLTERGERQARAVAEKLAPARLATVVCHGGILNAYLSHLFQSGYDHLVSVYFTSITVVRAADTRRAVLTVNDYAHLMVAA